MLLGVLPTEIYTKIESPECYCFLFLKEIEQTSTANNVKEMLFLAPVDHSKEDLLTDGCGSRSRDLHKDVLQLGERD